MEDGKRKMDNGDLSQLFYYSFSTDSRLPNLEFYILLTLDLTEEALLTILRCDLRHFMEYTATTLNLANYIEHNTASRRREAVSGGSQHERLKLAGESREANALVEMRRASRQESRSLPESPFSPCYPRDWQNRRSPLVFYFKSREFTYRCGLDAKTVFRF